MSVLPCDESGYAIPAADLLCDALNECELLDPEWADPLDWPAWTDQRFTLGPDLDLDLDHADDEDLDELPVFEPSDEDLEDARRVSEWQDMLEQSARFTDEDLVAAGLPVG